MQKPLTLLTLSDLKSLMVINLFVKNQMEELLIPIFIETGSISHLFKVKEVFMKIISSR